MIAQNLEIRSLYPDPVLLLKQKECRIQTSYIKYIHPINMSKIEENVLLISKVSRGLNSQLAISKLVMEKSRALMNNLRQIKPITPRRIRRWDALGTAWKWLAGTPDAEDLRMLNSTSNNLIEQNNQQIVINEMVNQRIQDITKTVNQLIEQQRIENKILLEEYDAITLMLYIDTINSILVEIQDTILKARIRLPNNKLLTLQEILWIESTLHKQGIQTQLPEQALNYVIPKIAIKGSSLLYILQVPQLENTTSEIIQILPLIVDNTVIIDIPRYVIKSGNKWYKTSNQQDFVQPLNDLTLLNDQCVQQILKGQTSKCRAVNEQNTFISQIAENKILVNNAQNVQLRSNCGPENRNLTGNFVIMFNNCNLQLDNQHFTSIDIIGNETQVIQGAFPNLTINREILELHSIEAISNLTLQNRSKMEHLQLRQFNHGNWITSILAGLSTTTLMMLGIILFVCLRKKKTIINIRLPRTKSTIVPTDRSTTSVS